MQHGCEEMGMEKKWNPHPRFPHLRQLLEEAHILLIDIEHEVKWIPREDNFEADALAKKHLKIDEGTIEEVICEKCSSKMVKRKGKYGEFWGCSRYPKCNFTKKFVPHSN